METSRQVTLPSEFEPAMYRKLNRDLRSMTDLELANHYEHYGRPEGRRSHAIEDRSAFAALIPLSADALEIGPFHSPLLVGPRVRYFDVLGRGDLIERARSIGFPINRIPREVHYVSPTGDLGIVDKQYDAILSSHAIEHQPDLILHLQQVEKLLRPGGRYFILIPDKRYCFDHFLAESTIADIVDAYHAGTRRHSLSNQIKHLVLTTHNDSKRHWRGDHGAARLSTEAIGACVNAYRAEPERYVDVHAWFFTPQGFEQNIQLLGQLDYTRLRVERLYPTLRATNEFWVVLDLPTDRSC